LEQQIDLTLRNFVIENFLYGDRNAALDSRDSFLEKGIVDSTGVLELVSYLEETFEIKVEDEEIIPDNFDSIANLTGYIQRKRSGEADAG
jgi:acyl carrier protein